MSVSWFSVVALVVLIGCAARVYLVLSRMPRDDLDGMIQVGFCKDADPNCQICEGWGRVPGGRGQSEICPCRARASS